MQIIEVNGKKAGNNKILGKEHKFEGVI